MPLKLGGSAAWKCCLCGTLGPKFRPGDPVYEKCINNLASGKHDPLLPAEWIFVTYRGHGDVVCPACLSHYNENKEELAKLKYYGEP